MKPNTREQLEALEQENPDGLQGDIHYLAGLFNYDNNHVEIEIETTIRMWEYNTHRRPDQENEQLLAKLREVEK